MWVTVETLDLGNEKRADGTKHRGSCFAMLGQHPVNPDLLRLLHELGVSMQSEQQNVSVRRKRPDVSCCVEAIHYGHGEIQNNHIRRQSFDHLNRLLPIFSFTAYLPIRLPLDEQTQA